MLNVWKHTATPAQLEVGPGRSPALLCGGARWPPLSGRWPATTWRTVAAP